MKCLEGLRIKDNAYMYSSMEISANFPCLKNSENRWIVPSVGILITKNSMIWLHKLPLKSWKKQEDYRSKTSF